MNWHLWVETLGCSEKSQNSQKGFDEIKAEEKRKKNEMKSTNNVKLYM